MRANLSDVSRRDAFKFLGLATAATALRGPLAWAESAATTTAAIERMTGAGFYPTTVGKLPVTIISDGLFSFPNPHPLFGANTTRDAVATALYDNFIEYDQMIGHVNTLLIQAGRDVILIDTGTAGAFGPTSGHFFKHLARTGVDVGDITHVVLTHLHGDHTNGLLTTDGQLAFPKAKILVHKAEADFWGADAPDLSKSGLSDDYKTAFVAGAKKVLAAAKPKLVLLDGDKSDLTPGVTAVLAAGHTPGHMIIDLQSDGQSMTYITDLTHQPSLTFTHPDWTVGFDTDMKAAAAARASFYERLAAGRTRIAGSHIPFPALGHLRKAAEGYQFVAEDWRWNA